jgi:hypothetical protein
MGKTIGLIFQENPVERHPCPRCGKEYKTAEALAKHIKEKHAGDEVPEA